MTPRAARPPRLFAGAAAVAALVAALAVLPQVLSIYGQGVLTLLAIELILVLGYRLVTTMGGWSFCHAAIMGLGAYTMAILTTAAVPWSFWSTLVLGPLVAAAFALLIAYPVLRTRHHYFFLSTFAAGEALRQCFIQWRDLTGGTNGIAFIRRPEPLLGIDFDTAVGFYYLSAALLLAVAAALYGFDRSRTGQTIKAVAANEELSESLGIDTWRHRTLAFVAGSGIAGLAGVLYGAYNGIINPSDFGVPVMFKIVAAAIVGGTTTLLGPVLGLIYLTILEEAFRGTAQLVPLLWGLSIVVVLLLSPGGLETLLRRRFLRRQRGSIHA